MSDIAIRVDHLSKLYHIGRAQGRHDALRDALVDRARRLKVQDSRLKVAGSGTANLQPSNLEPPTDLCRITEPTAGRAGTAISQLTSGPAQGRMFTSKLKDWKGC